MAIIPGIPGLEVSILVDSQPLPEYSEEDESDSVPPGTITKFVESRAGSEFAIQIKFGVDFLYASDDTIVVKICIDGHRADCRLIDQTFRRTRFPVIIDVARFMEEGVWKKAKFRFTDIVVGEDVGDGNNMDLDLKAIKNLGSIQVRCYRAVKISEAAGSSKNLLLGVGSVTEHKLKGSAVSQRVKFAHSGEISLTCIRQVDEYRLLEPEVIAPITTMKCTYPFGKDPFTMFNFQYRSRQSLQSLLLLPRSPSPVPLEDRDIAELTREELEELVRRQKSVKKKQEQIDQHVVIKKELKREHAELRDGNEDDDEVMVIEKRAKVIEIIDLSDD